MNRTNRKTEIPDKIFEQEPKKAPEIHNIKVTPPEYLT